jgi:hypothetical protein
VNHRQVRAGGASAHYRPAVGSRRRRRRRRLARELRDEARDAAGEVVAEAAFELVVRLVLWPFRLAGCVLLRLLEGVS